MGEKAFENFDLYLVQNYRRLLSTRRDETGQDGTVRSQKATTRQQ